MAKKQKLYYVKWFNADGWNYRDTSNCDWEAVKECRRRAKAMGEKITYELM